MSHTVGMIRRRHGSRLLALVALGVGVGVPVDVDAAPRTSAQEPPGQPFIADTPGELPTEPAPIVGGVQMPPGRLLVPDPWYESDDVSEPVAWMTDEVVDETGRLLEPLREAFAETGLWPVVLAAFMVDESRPWEVGEVCPDCATDPTHHDAQSVLAASWAAESEFLGPDQAAPFGSQFPGLAPASTGELDDDALAEADEYARGLVALVPARRPADVLVQLGWTGPVNYFQDVGALSAVLRSWEDRFGAVVVEIGFAELGIAVRRPPDDEKAATAVAAELFAFCPDIVFQGYESIAALGEGIDGAPGWYFWWD